MGPVATAPGSDFAFMPELDEFAANDYNAHLSGKHVERYEMIQVVRAAQ